MHIGNSVRALRKARGLTQEQLAAVGGLDAATLSRFENGLIDIQISTLGRVAAALGVPEETLLAERDMETGVALSTGLLDLAGAAAVLGTSTLGLSRLIARGRLRAMPLGAKPTWRIDAGELARYVRAGAADFDLPWPVDGPWFPEVRSAAHFPQAIINVAGDQVPENMPANVPEGGAVQLKITPAVAAVIAAPPSILVSETRAVPMPKEAAFPDWRTAYLTERVRNFALQVVGVRDGFPPLPRLYASPDIYIRTIGEAVRLTLAGAISFGKIYTWMEGGLPVERRVSFELPHAALAPAGTVGTVVQFAF